MIITAPAVSAEQLAWLQQQEHAKKLEQEQQDMPGAATVNAVDVGGADVRLICAPSLGWTLHGVGVNIISSRFQVDNSSSRVKVRRRCRHTWQAQRKARAPCC
jgi:hypothetical protein